MTIDAGPVWMFCPADRPERYGKAAAAADVVIIDLEDAVAASDKDAARQAMLETPLDPERTVVRINPRSTPYFDADLAAVLTTQYRHVMVPKCESAEDVRAVAPLSVVALVETPLGVLRAAEICATDGCVAMMWGAEDLIAALGGASSRRSNGRYRDVAVHARSTALLAASAFGRLALDSVYLDMPDLDGLRAESEDAVAVGFGAKVALHPSQAAVIRECYTPSADQVDWARRVVAAASTERGVFTVDGRMVDAPVIRHADRILRGVR
jgi:citrate lyase subunit beta/citryl-CoA lyase